MGLHFRKKKDSKKLKTGHGTAINLSIIPHLQLPQELHLLVTIEIWD